MLMLDHTVEVPLDWNAPADASITVFAREIVDPARRTDDLPILLFLQGGPGGAGPRPQSRSGWLATALKTHRVVLLDQRGTGRSTPVDAALIGAMGGEAGANYLSHFRADSIVRDAEHLRRTDFGGRRWETLGQSYGGFVTLTYLSHAPEALAACYVTGGLAGLNTDAATVYRHTYPRVAAKTAEYYSRYPDDVERAGRVADIVAAGGVRLPDGDELSVRRLQTLGQDFGMKPGYERMHWLFDTALRTGADGAASGELSDTFLAAVLARTSYLTNPMYAVMHESIYAGQATGPTSWAADRMRPADCDAGRRPLPFTGEMIYPWMFDEIKALRPFRAAVDVLAARDDWPDLYDSRQLARNEVPVAAAVYYDDMYVDSGLQLETAASVGNSRAWVTNEFEHDGIGEGALDRLIKTVNDFGGPLRP